MEVPSLALTCIGEEDGRIIGVLVSPHGDFKIDASPDGWAEIERAVADGRNPVVLTAATNEQEIHS